MLPVMMDSSQSCRPALSLSTPLSGSKVRIGRPVTAAPPSVGSNATANAHVDEICRLVARFVLEEPPVTWARTIVTFPSPSKNVVGDAVPRLAKASSRSHSRRHEARSLGPVAPSLGNERKATGAVH